MFSFHNISKRFGGVQALRDVSFEIGPGTIHAIVGENGAGKSTLMKIAAGIHPPDAGEIHLDGQPVTIASPRQARELKIALVPQEPALCPNLSVAENLVLGNEPSRHGVLDRAATTSLARSALERAALDVPLHAPVERLSPAQRHLLQIARSLAQDARVLILDEPTAALSSGETEHLFGRLQALRDDGVTILYISHRLPEIFSLCDAITVLRDGQHIATQSTRDITPDEIVRQMVGRALEEEDRAADTQIAHSSAHGEQPILRVENLSREGGPHDVAFHDISFQIRPGEIVALTGLVGSGRSEIARCLFGLDLPTSGRMEMAGQEYSPRSPREAIQSGLALVPEDRRGQGLVMPLDVRANLSLPALASTLAGLAPCGVIQQKSEQATAQARVQELAIKTDGLDAGVETLSGGNQQKVVLGKWLTTAPQLLIVDEPTQGVDVGAKAQVHHLLRDLAARGFGVLLISSDLPEVLHLAHRILVMREGRLAGELSHGASGEDVMRLAALGEC